MTAMPTVATVEAETDADINGRRHVIAWRIAIVAGPRLIYRRWLIPVPITVRWPVRPAASATLVRPAPNVRLFIATRFGAEPSHCARTSTENLLS